MIRYAYINQLVLQIYSALPQIKFPLNMQEVISLIKSCRIMSYQDFAKINNCSIDDVINLCQSKSGCTHYDINNDRYLILCNTSTANNNNLGRQRWTCSHEIGHILCKHFELSAYQMLSENGFFKNKNSEFESEADYFAATLLAPFPLYKILEISSALDVQNIFGLSTEASLYRYKEYIKWKKNHIKNSWENDMVSIYRTKKQ